jgi:hypothetical protein
MGCTRSDPSSKCIPAEFNLEDWEQEEVLSEDTSWAKFQLYELEMGELNPLPSKNPILASKHFIGTETPYIVLVSDVTTPFSERGLSHSFIAREATGVEVYCGKVRHNLTLEVSANTTN